jgi:hypothetical protein
VARGSGRRPNLAAVWKRAAAARWLDSEWRRREADARQDDGLRRRRAVENGSSGRRQQVKAGA